MATLRKIKSGKYYYWQIVTSKRIDGKPKPVVLMHLGTADSLLKKLKGGTIKKKVKSTSHGAVLALWKISKNLGFFDAFRTHFAQQKRQGLLVGESLLLAAFHRALSPGSKKAFSQWMISTSLPVLTGVDPLPLNSQHFWDQMNTVSDRQLQNIETRITKIMKERDLISEELLFYDTTNFFTYIDSENHRTKLAQRGKNKQKRNDLRQFGLAQIVTREFILPICSEVYEGNRSDSTLFLPQLTRLRQRLEELHIQMKTMTLVFDKGSNSKKNFNGLDYLDVHYVASLTPAYHEDLLAIPKWRYYLIRKGEKRVRCYRTKKTVWGKERTIVLYISDKLYHGQCRSLEHVLGKKFEALRQLKEQLNSPKARPRKRDVLEKTVQKILSGERGDLLIDVTIISKKKGRFDIQWSLDRFAYDWLKGTLFGKRILVSSREQWSEEDIIAAYQGQSHVERVFKQIKNPYHHAVRPQFHWTDQKIKVHTFICLIGCLLSQILWKKVSEAGIKISPEMLLDELSKIRRSEIISLSSLSKKPEKEVILEEMDELSEKIYNCL